jgi:hypothetical protein
MKKIKGEPIDKVESTRGFNIETFEVGEFFFLL